MSTRARDSIDQAIVKVKWKIEWIKLIAPYKRYHARSVWRMDYFVNDKLFRSIVQRNFLSAPFYGDYLQASSDLVDDVNSKMQLYGYAERDIE